MTQTDIASNPDLAAVELHARRLEARKGVICGLSAHLLWGFFPIYFKMIAQVPPLQIVAHRIAWSLVVVAIITAAQRGWAELRAITRDRRAMLMLAASTIILTTNWFIFIYAVNTDRTVQASLGYFINPLFSVLLGMVFLGERSRPGQAVGLVIAAIGVFYLTWSHGNLPWIALALAASFGSYGLLRKTVRAGALAGLTIETMLLFIPALLTILIYHGQGHVYSPRMWMLLPLSGLVTAIPYLLFAAAARRLRLMTMGFLQYVTPTCHFILAVYAFNEKLLSRDLISFGLIWTALAIYSWDSWRAYRRVNQ